MSTSDSAHEVDNEAEIPISTSALKARFEDANEEAPVRRNFVINKGNPGEAATKFNQSASTTTKCHVCSKTVYPMEKLEVDGQIFHKTCFRCETCKNTLGLGNYASLQGQYYCKPHLKQLFQLKGNYDEGFGREQRKADWVAKSDKPCKSSTKASDAMQQEQIKSNDSEAIEHASGVEDQIESNDSEVIEPASEVEDQIESNDSEVIEPASEVEDQIESNDSEVIEPASEVENSEETADE